MKTLQHYIIIALFGLFSFSSCTQQEVKFNSENAKFQAIQIQKFDYQNSRGSGNIYKGEYNKTGDTVYFHVTYYPDETAPSFTDWQIQATLASGVMVQPSLSSIQDLSQPKSYELTASDGVAKKQVVLKLLIYEIEYGDLEHGFGRYNKLFEKKAADLGLTADYQRNMAVSGDYLIVSNGVNNLLVYDKRTGAKKDVVIPKPANFNIWSVFADEDGVLLASNNANFSATSLGTVSIYRWKDGLDKQPELFHQFTSAGISLSGAGFISNAAVKGSTTKDASIMFDVDGRGRAENKAIRVAIANGKADPTLDVFNKPVTSVWNGKVVPMSSTSRIPFVGAMLGFPPSMGVQSNAGIGMFTVDPAKSNFLNMIIAGLHYFEFNHAKYLAVATSNWPGDYRLLIFNMDDLSLVSSTKANIAEYEAFNLFSEDLLFKNVASAGDVTVQVQPDGKTALVYVLAANAGIAAYELTIIGGK